MNILFISYAFSPSVGGIETVSELLAKEFVNMGHSVVLVTSVSSNNSDNFEYKVFRNPSLFKLFELNSWADLVFENNLSLRLTWPTLLMRKPIVTVIQTWITRVDGSMSIIDFLKRIKLKFSNQVVAISSAVKNLSYKDSIIIPNPVSARLLKSDYFNSEREFDFVFLGRLVSDKGCNLAIEAIKQLKDEGINSSLVVIGDGDERRKLESFATSLQIADNILFKGTLKGDILMETLSKCRFIVVPSLWKEPFGVVALEGMACGCVPIVADGGGLPDAVGDAGIIFERGSLLSLTQAMKKIILDEERAETIKKLIPYQLAKHSSDIVAASYIKLFFSNI